MIRVMEDMLLPRCLSVNMVVNITLILGVTPFTPKLIHMYISSSLISALNCTESLGQTQIQIRSLYLCVLFKVANTDIPTSI